MLARTDGPGVPPTTISTAWPRRLASLWGQPASSMNRFQYSGSGSSLLSSDCATCTPRIRARWSERSRWRPSRASEVAARLSILAVQRVVRHHPGVPAAAALRAVDDQGAWLERDAGESTGSDAHVGPGEDERTQVLVCAPQPAAVEDRLD